MRRSWEFFFLIFLVLGILVLRLAGFLVVVVLTNSMIPTINPGDAVIVTPAWLDHPHVGDVIAFRVHTVRGDVVVVHREVGVRGGGFVTKGDNRSFRDPWVVYPDQILGVVVLRIPRVGWLFYWFSLLSPLILVFVLLWAAQFVFKEEKRRYRRRVFRRTRQREALLRGLARRR